MKSLKSFETEILRLTPASLASTPWMSRSALFLLCLHLALPAALLGQATDFQRTHTRAQRGEPTAQYELGRLYENGDGVRQDPGVAVKWYRQAALQNSVQAQYRLGRMYDSGAGVRQSQREAARWYRQAAAEGDALAQNRLGVMYQRGEGVPQDYVEAYKWFTLAAGPEEKVFAAANRDALAQLMPPDQIAAATLRAAPFLAENSATQIAK
jgi:hypothetical protein